MVWAPILKYVRLAKIAENGTDYSLQNTTRHALFLPTSREAKYKAKAAIDTFPQRAGDMLSACLVGLAVLLRQPVGHIALINLALIGAWLVIAVGIGRRYRKLSATTEVTPPKA